MLSSTQKRFSLFAFFLFVLFGNNFNLNAQCNLNITDFQNPSSCYASDGFFTANATNGACGRLIRIYKNNAIIAQGVGTVIASGLSSGEYEIIADNNCGCSNPSNQIINLFAGTSTPLTPYVDAGLGSYQADKVYICRGSNLKIGVQSLGVSGLQLTGPNGFSDSTPDGNSYWNLNNLQPSHSGRYTINFTNAAGCISTVNINVEVGTLAVNLGADKTGCFGLSHTLVAGVSGQGTCRETCPSTLDSLLVRWTLDQCNASNQNNQYDYTELQPEYPSNGNCIRVTAKNVYRSHGEHSCTPVLGSYNGDVGICIPAMDSCNPLLYNSDNAVKIEVTITPQEAGRLSKISFKEQSPLQWITTNGSTGINNYNTKYLVRVYKNNLLIYAEDERISERTWNLETIDFGNLPAFAVTETSTFRIELRGYCVVQQQGGNMSGWELDDIRIFGGCCTGLPVTDSVSYLWSNGETTPSITVTPTQNTNYTVTVTDCKGCTSTDEIGISVFPLPTASISGKTSICIGGTTVLTASGGATYLWSTGATTSSIITAPAATTQYSVTVTSSDGCSSTASLDVVVNPLPSPVITGDFEICIGQSTVLTASGGMSYEWSTGEFGQSITVSPLVSTTYLVMAMDENGCMEYTSALVVVNPLPVPVLTGDNEICLGESTVLTATGGTGFLWSTGSIESIITVSPTISSTYSVTVTDNNGCSATTAVDITVNPLPVAIISGNTTFCTGASSLLTASGGSSYVWNTGATTSSIMVNPGMNTAYTVTVTDGKGCTSSASRMTSVNTLPEANIEGAKKICQGSSTTLIASGGVIFSWDTGQTTSAINVSPSSTTIYRVTVTDVNGCTGTSAHAVIVNQNPVVNISGKNEFCVGESTVLTANVSGTTYCDKDCIDEILLQWSLDQCNSDGLPNQLSYTEFIPTTVNAGGLNTITGTHLKRDRGDHSCTPDGTGGVGLCFGALESCDPNFYNPLNGLKFSVRMQPNEVGKLTRLTFREQSPLNWVTTNGSTGINNYNQKYLIRVYKDGNLVYSKNNLNTERDWNLETFDFTDHPEFRITTLSLFTFELYGYCTVERGGTAGWEIDDIRIYGGECSSSPSLDNISYLWSTGATTNSINVSPILTTTYDVTVTDCNGCIGSDEYLVNVNPLPTPLITGDNELCFRESTTLTASGGSSYVWSNGSTTSRITVSPTTTTTYSVTVTDDKGCIASTSETVIVNPLPVPSITGDNEICFGESTTLTASGGSSYVWSNGSTTSSITVSPTTTTTYSVTVTDDKGCIASISETVIVNPLPVPSITGDNEICFGESTTLTANGGSSYVWSNGSTTSIIKVSPTTTTTYSVTVTDDKGCITSTSETVIVNPLPTPSITGDNELCFGESTTLTASGGSSYVWSNGSTTSSITVSPTTTSTYSVTVTDDKGCIASTSETVIVNPLPTPFITGDNEICFGESTTLSASGGSSYEWSNGSTTSSITISPTATTTYSVTVTDDKGCIASTSETVIVNPLPTPFITGDNEICFGESTTLTASEGSSYVWSNGATTSIITISPTTTTTYSVTVTDDKGCIASTSETVIVNPLPTPSIGGDNEICFGESTTLTASGGSSYEWSNGSTTSSITIIPTATTTYSVTVTDDKGCIASTSETVIVNPLPTPFITGDNEICFGESTTLSASGGSSYEWSNGATTSSITISPTATTTYSVTVTDDKGCIASTSETVIVNPLPTPSIGGDNEICFGESTTLTASGGSSYVWSNGSTTSSITISPSTTTTYSVTVSDDKGCSANTSVTVIVNPLPTPTIGGDTELCNGESTTLTVSGGSSYLWSNGSTAVSITVGPTETTTYGVTVSDVNGCSGSASVTVKVNALPDVNISGDKEICLNECTTLTASGGVSYEWGNVMSSGYSCSGAFYVGGPQGGSDQSLYVINSGNNLTTIGSLGTNNVNGIGYYCQGGNTPYIYGMKMRGNTITDALRANFVRINPETAGLSILNEIPQPPNPYGITGTTGIMAYIGEVSKEGIYYFPAVSALINPLTFSIVDYTIYLGSIDLNNHGNGSNVNYRVISVLPGCKPYMDACIEAFQRYALDPSGREPSGGIQDWALSEDGKTMYSYFGIENALFRMDMGTASTNCVAGPGSNGIYTGVTGVKTDEFGGIYFRGGELYGLQVDRGRLFRIDRESGLLTLLTEGLPTDYRGDNATCGDCGNPGTGPIDTEEITVCPTETTTYSVKVTDINGCVATATVTVKVNPLPTPTIVGDTEICNGESTTLTASGGSSYVWSNGSTTSSITVSPSSTTTYGVTVTDGNSCTGTSGVTVVVNPLPTPTIIGDTEICRGESTGLFAVGGSSYVWSNGSTTSSITISPSTTTTYSVTVSDNKGCSANTSVTVIVNPLPTPTIGGDTELCNGESTTLTVSGGSSYLWSNGSTAVSITVGPTETTTYGVTVSDVNGCSGSASVTVKVNALPDVNISGDKEICLNECTTLTASGGVSYEWGNVMSSGYSCSGAFYVGGPQGGSDQSLYVINSGNNLTTIGSLGTNNVNGIGYYCQGGNTPYIYGMKMRGNTITDALRANFVRINPETAGLSILNEIPQPPNPYGITGTTGIMAYIGEVSKEGIYYFPAVSALINPLTFSIVDYTIYLGSIDLNNHGNGSNVNYRVISVLPGCKPYMDACIEAFQRYALDPSGREPSGGIQDWALSEDGKTMYSYFGIENALFRMDMGTASTNCVAGPGSNGIYTGVTGVKTDEFGGIYFRGGELYGLQVDRGRLFRIDRESGLLTLLTEGLPTDYRGDNATCGDCGNPGTGPIDTEEITVCPTETTTYSVKVTDINGCVATATVTVKVNPLPTPTIVGDTEICNGESTTLTASGGSSYVWSNGSTTSSITVSPSSTTTYGVTVTDGNSCTGTSGVTVVVNPLPTPTIIGDTEICRGESTGLFAVGGISYVWSTGSTTGLINVSPTITTTYSVTVSDDKGCSANTSVTVIVNPLPTPTIGGDTELCNGESTTLTVSGGSSYLWSNGSTAVSITVGPTETTTYGVTVSDVNGCSGSASVTVKVNALPDVNISGDKEICLNECTTLTASGGVSYEWGNVMSSGYSCSGAFYVGGPQGGSDQSLYVINSGNNLTTIGSLGTNNVNGIGYYCQGGNTPYIYGMKMRGNTITDALRANFVRINPETAGLSILNEIPQPPNPYGITGTTGIMAYIGEVSKEGIYYFPAVSALINPLTFSIVDYTIYLGSIDLNNHGNGSNVNYRVISVLPGCKPYMDACIEAFQRYALDPSGREPSGGIQDWALSEDGKTMYSYFGIENALFRMDMGTASTNCVAGPGSNGIYTGVTGVKTDEFGGIYFRGGELYGLQVDRGRLFRIDRESGLLTLLTEGLPTDYRGDNATCGDCGNPGTGPIDTEEITVCPTETTTYSVKVTDINGCVATATVTVKVNPLPTPTIVGDTEICNGESTTLTASGGSSYVWSNGSTTSSITVSPSSTTTYGVTVTDGNSCTGTSGVTVVVNPLPTPTIIGDTEICRGESTGLFAVGGSSYIWSTGSTTGLINVSPTITTTYSVTVSDNKGCSANTSVTVIVNPLPTPTIGGDTELCNGESTTLTVSGGSSYLWSNGSTAVSITVGPTETTTYGVTVSDVNGCSGSASVTVKVNALPDVNISGDKEICLNECTTLTASGGVSYEWGNVMSSGYSCNGAFYVGGPQGGSDQSLYVINSGNNLTTIGSLGTNNVNGIGYYCQGGNTPYIYGMKMRGNTITDALRANFVRINPETAGLSILNEIPQPPNPYGITGTTGIMAYIGEVSKEGIYYFPAVSALINPLTFSIVDYTIYLGSIDLNNHGNGSNVNYRVISVLPGCKPYMDACIEAFQRYALDPSGREPSGGIQDWALSEDGKTMYSYFGIENALFRMDMGTASTNCVAGPGSNGIYTGVTGVKTDEFGGIYFRGGELYGLQVDRGRLFRIDRESGLLTLLTEGLPTDYRGDNATCGDCGNPGTGPIDTEEITVCPTETTTYSVKVTDINGCVATATVTVKVNPLPTPTIVGDTEICNGESTTLTASGGSSYVWSNGSTTSSITVSPSSTTTYGVTVTDGNSCTGTSGVTVVVNPLPTPTIIGDTEICRGESTGLFAVGGISYVWSTGSTTGLINVSPTITTTYSVTVSDDKGCSANTSVTVIVNPLPTPTIGGDTELCNGESTTLTVSGGSSYVWSNGSTAVSITVNPTETRTYGVTVTDNKGCSANTSVTVIINLLPTPSITGDTELCYGESTTLTASGGTVYLWNNASTTSSITVNPTVMTTYGVTVTNGNGCSSATNVTVIVNPLPSLSISGDNELCNGESTILTASGGSSYVWSNGSTTSSITVNPSATMTYGVTTTDGNGCSSSASVTVIVNPLPSPSISGDNELCNGESTTLTVSGGSSYVWSNGATTSSITVNPSTTMTYGVTATDGNGCSSSASVTVEVNSLPTPTIAGDTEICNGESTILTASGGSSYVWSNGSTSNIISVNPTINTTYSVTVTDGNGCKANSSSTVKVNILPTPTIVGDTEICNGESTTLTASGGSSYVWSNGSTSNSISVNPTINTTYSVTVTDGNGCKANTSSMVKVNILPTPTIVGDTEICNGESTTLTASGGSSYVWSNGSTSNSISVNPTINTTYSVTVTDVNGCKANTSSTVRVNILPTPTIVGDTEICNGESTTLTASGGSSYVWSNGSTAGSISVNPTINTTYSVTVTDVNGCSSTTNVTVQVNALPLVNIIGDNEICIGESTTLTASEGIGYIWSNGVTTNSFTVNPEVSASYSVTVTDGKGCQSNASITVVVNSLPIVTIGGDNDICLGESTTLTAGGGIGFVWSNGLTASSITVNPTVTTNYTVTVTDVKGCQNTKNIIVVVNPLPVALISGVNNICSGQSTILSASGGTSYIWSNGSTTTSITVSPLSATTYSITVSTQQGCSASASIMIFINQAPAIQIVGPNNICKGDSTVLVATGSSLNNCPGECKVNAPVVLSYWNLDACHSVMNLGTHMDYSEFTPITANGSCTIVTASNVHRLNNNKHSCTPGPDGSIGMCIGTQNTCNPSKVDFSQALRFHITINPLQSGQITGLQFYEQSPTNFRWVGGPTGPNNYATKYLIRVSKNGEYIYYEDNLNTNKTWGLESFDFSENDNFKTLIPATYLFELVPYCTINNNAVESIWDIDEIKVLGGCCQGTTKEITSYLWSNGEMGTSITVNPIESTTYTVTVTDCSGCSSVEEYDVTVACLMADLGPDRMINLGETVELSPVISGKSLCSDLNSGLNNIKYLWSNGATTSSITVTPSSSTFYRVTVTDCNECEDTESISIHVMMTRPFIVYPNPASDRINLASESVIDPNLVIRILSVDGKTVISENPHFIINSLNNVSIIIPENITDGIYFLEVKNGTKVFTEKLILIK